VAAWSEYQEEVASFFREIGFDADTNVRLNGVRTAHEVDVLLKAGLAGIDVRWIVECKCWNSPIPKEKVLTLRSIVDDTGVDRGVLMAESGYQSGALEAARLANVMLTSLGDLKETLRVEIDIARLRSLQERVEACRERYWDLDKEVRIDFGLRPAPGAMGYMGDAVIRGVDNTVVQALRHGFPITYERTFAALAAFAGRPEPVDPDAPDAIGTPGQLYEVLNAELTELERLLQSAESGHDPAGAPLRSSAPGMERDGLL